VRLQELFGTDKIEIDDLREFGYAGNDSDIRLFGDNIVTIFNTPQAMCGFGAAIGRLKNVNILSTFANVEEQYSHIICGSGDSKEWVIIFLIKMEELKNRAKKIGNSQRMYFQYFFRELFNNEGNSFLNLEQAVSNGYQKYKSQV
jgi:hypothetical protein